MVISIYWLIKIDQQIRTWRKLDTVQQRVPPMQHLGHVIQTSVVEVQDLVLRLPGGHNQLTARATIVVEE